MKTSPLTGAAILLLCGAAVCHALTPANVAEVAISYDADVWKPVPTLAPPPPAGSATWENERGHDVQITVRSRPEAKTDAEFKEGIVGAQQLRGDPATLLRERRGSLGGREWLVLEFRNPNTRPTRTETYYFTPTAKGHVSVFIVGDESTWADRREPVQAFLEKIKVE